MLGVAACGGDDSGDSADAPPEPAKAADFPKAAGKTVAQLRKEASGAGPVLAPTQSQLTPGKNRYGFALFDRDRTQIADVPVALYVAKPGRQGHRPGAGQVGVAEGPGAVPEPLHVGRPGRRQGHLRGAAGLPRARPLPGAGASPSWTGGWSARWSRPT